MSQFRIEKGNFTITSNEIYSLEVNGSKMTLEAWGLYSFMLSLPEDWDYTINGLTKVVKAGRDRIAKLLRELEQFGLLERTQSNDGRFGKIEYTLYRTSRLNKCADSQCTEVSDNPISENENLNKSNEFFKNLPYTENPYTVNPTQTKYLINKYNNKINNDKGEITVVFPPSYNIHFLVKEMITKNFISATDYDLIKFNDLFTQLDYNYDYRLVLATTRYLLDNYFKNKDKIFSKYHWFETSIRNNIEMLAAEMERAENFGVKSKYKTYVDEPDWLQGFIDEFMNRNKTVN